MNQITVVIDKVVIDQIKLALCPCENFSGREDAVRIEVGATLADREADVQRASRFQHSGKVCKSLEMASWINRVAISAQSEVL